MYWMSARCRRARPPFSTTKRAPEIRPAASKSICANRSPIATWSSGVYSNSRGVPQRRTSTFEFSSRPSGTLSCSMFGSPSMSSSNSACTATSSLSRPSSLRASRLPSSIRVVTSSPLPFAMPTFLACALRAERVSSAATCAALRRSSSARKRSTSRLKPRRARLAATAAGSERSRRASSIVLRFSPEEYGIETQFYQDGWSPLPAASHGRPAKRSTLPRTQALQRLADLDLKPAVDRLVVARGLHLVGEVLFAGRKGIGLVVGVAVPLAIAEALHEAGRGIAQAQRHVERAELLRILHRGPECHVHGVALRGTGHEHHGLGNRELSLGAAEPLE